MDQTPPRLFNFGVDFDAFDVATGMAGDFDFKKTTTLGAGTQTNCQATDRLFLEFGALATGGNLLPTFEYIVNEAASVLSPINGVVESVELQAAGDYAILLRPTANSAWRLEIDHVLNVTVSPGSSVTAGQVLGSAGIWAPEDDQGRVEIMLYNGNLAYCPLDYVDSSVRANLISRLTQHMNEWESAACKNQTVWDRSAMETIGCSCRTMSTSGDTSQCTE